MADRLVELYEKIGRKFTEVDSGVGRLVQDDPELAREWEELKALVAQQRELLDDIARRTSELSSLSAFLQTHYEREKASLARELHDQLGGILTPAKMDLAWLQARSAPDPQYGERVTRLSGMIDQGIDLKRRIIEKLRPSLLDHLGFAAAVQWFADETCTAAKLQCTVKISKLERLSPDLEIALYRVVQESLDNIVRHAQATKVDLVVERRADGVCIAVCDDGVGISDLETARKRSHGLVGMAQRMRAIGGKLDISKRSGGGTKIEAFLPLAA